MKKFIFINSVFLILFALIANSYASDSNFRNKARIAIVIDDLGDNSVIAKQFLDLPIKLTVGILPHTPQSKLIAELARDKGHEVILHLPMEAYTRPDLLGPGALFSDMDRETFVKLVNKNIASIPHIVGVNNHMGSKLTEDKEKMEWLMEELATHSLYFLDSKTSESSIAKSIAIENNIPSISRDVFLDHSVNLTDMMIQLKHLKFIAKRNGQAVLICHPYGESLQFLKKNINTLNKQFEILTLNELF